MTDPFSLVTVMRFRAQGLSEAARILLDQMAAFGFAAPDHWARSDVNYKPMENAAAVLEELRKRPGKRPAVNFESSDLWAVLLTRDDEEGRDVWVSHLSHQCRQVETPELLARHAALLRGFAAGGHVVRAYVERENGGVLCLPEVPFAGFNANIVAMPPERAALGYDAPEKFFEAGWKRETVNDLLFLERGMTARDNAEYLEEIIGGQWAMARASKPGQTKYYWPKVEVNEKAIYRSGRSALELVGYVVRERTVEFSCILGSASDHIQGWEAFIIFALLQEKKTADGDPVEAVRVVFFEAWMAEQEKRPLLDIGARVFYNGQDGNLAEVLDS